MNERDEVTSKRSFKDSTLRRRGREGGGFPTPSASNLSTFTLSSLTEEKVDNCAKSRRTLIEGIVRFVWIDMVIKTGFRSSVVSSEMKWVIIIWLVNLWTWIFFFFLRISTSLLHKSNLLVNFYSCQVYVRGVFDFYGRIFCLILKKIQIHGLKRRG